jgi:PAS domain S-box-containing protein
VPFRFGLDVLPWAVMSVALLVLAWAIYQRQRASRVGVLFCVMILLVAVWFIGYALMFASTTAEWALVFARLAFVGVALLPAAVYDFTATAVRLYNKRKPVISFAWALGGVWIIIIAGTPLLFPAVRRFSWGFYPQFGELGVPFLIFFFGLLLLHLVEYTLEVRRTADKHRRRRLVKLLTSFAIVYLACVDFIPMFGIDQRPLGYIPVVAFVAFAWGSIRRHRFRAITAARAAGEILETMADALFVIDSEARVRVINGAVRHLFGYTEHEILGKPIDVLEYHDPELTFSKTLQEMLRRAPIRDEERIFRDKNRALIDVSISVSPLRDNSGGAVVIVRDIRERKIAEDGLREFTTKLQQSNRELEDFAYVASHDLQEPLRKIQAFGDRLKARYGEVLSDEGRDYLERMQSAARRMQTLINDLLVFSRVTTKAAPFEPIDLNEVAKDVVHDLEVRIHQGEAEVSIGDLPEVDADPLQMRQLLQNLLGNALKFHKPGVPARVEVRGSAYDGSAEIVVSDNGIGFDEKYADRIFTMFERLHGRGTYEGTGIGLAICRKIAHRHGGDIRARSNPGEGSTFIVTLPVHHTRETI